MPRRRELGISNSFTLEASFCSPGYNEEQAMLTTAEKAYALIAKDGDDAGGRHGRGAAARSTLAAAAAAARDRASLLADRSAASSASFYARAAGSSGLRGFSALGDLETHRDEEKRDDPKPESTSFFEEPRGAVWNSNLQPDFNVRACDGFDARSSAVLRELDESNRFVQKSAESTSI